MQERRDGETRSEIYSTYDCTDTIATIAIAAGFACGMNNPRVSVSAHLTNGIGTFRHSKNTHSIPKTHPQWLTLPPITAA
jgi:hypothetical protein